MPKRIQSKSTKELREWVYIQRPREYEMAGCPCGNNDPEWSEFRKHLWCAKCKKDFIPKHSGVFDGPIPVNCSQLLGMSFDRINLLTKEIERCWPKRIQRKRTKGWRMPYATVYVGRPTKWGNPFKLWPAPGGCMPFVAVDNYKVWIEEPEQDELYMDVRRELRGKDLACWCPTTAFCHADVLLEIANSAEIKTE